MLLASIAGLLAAQLAPGPPMTLWFCRHAETVANATGKYNGKTINAFSPKGIEQIAKLTDRFWKTKIEVVLVSPSERALRTIAPYLRKAKRRAEIWPELYECCDANTRKIKGTTSATVRYGGKIVVPADIASLFTFRYGKDGKPVDRYIEAPSYEDGLRQIRMAASALRMRFAKSGHSVLVIGHSLQGGRMLELLQGRPMAGKIRPENGNPMMFYETVDGKFEPAKVATR